jgi:bifunctional DNA-binding transcriptional regulator/antitoxin component of YhaV-PrlF toxin-antitoxin module
MMEATIQIRSEGAFTFPAEFLDKYGLKEGEIFSIVDLGNGSFLLSPRRSRVDELADQLAAEWASRGETLESMLKTLREVREEYAAKSQQD